MHIRPYDEFIGAMYHNRLRHMHKFYVVIQKCKERKNTSFLHCAKGVALGKKKTYYKDADKTLNHVIEAIKIVIEIFLRFLKMNIIYNALIVMSE